MTQNIQLQKTNLNFPRKGRVKQNILFRQFKGTSQAVWTKLKSSFVDTKRFKYLTLTTQRVFFKKLS